jgi:hypothetical protein
MTLYVLPVTMTSLSNSEAVIQGLSKDSSDRAKTSYRIFFSVAVYDVRPRPTITINSITRFGIADILNNINSAKIYPK